MSGKNKQNNQQKQEKQSKPKLYEARIEHTEETLTQLYKTANLTYNMLGIIARMIFGLALILAALALEMPQALQILLMLIGCLVVVCGDFGSIYRAVDVVEKRHGRLPVMRYTFYEKDILLTGEGKMHLKYDTIERLVKDRNYLYLFQNRNSVCMVDKKTISPEGEKEFMEFIQGKTGQKWKENQSILSISLPDLLRAYKDRKKKK